MLGRKKDKTPKERDTALFGVPLEVAAERSDPMGLIPAPLRKSIEWLNAKGERSPHSVMFTPHVFQL